MQGCFGGELNSYHVKQTGKTKTTQKHPQHATSTVLAMLDQPQVQEFKEVRTDMASLTRKIFTIACFSREESSWCSAQCHDECSSRAHKSHHVPHDACEKLNGTGQEEVIRNAFACSEEEATGTIWEDDLRELLTIMGDWLTDEEAVQRSTY